MTPPDLVIFDCDGVLVDSENITNQIIRDKLAHHALDLDLDQIMTLFVGGTIMGVRDTAIGMGANLSGDQVNLIYQ